MNLANIENTIKSLVKFSNLNDATIQEIESRYVSICRLRSTNGFKKDLNKATVVYLGVRNFFISLLKEELTKFNSQDIKKIMIVIDSMKNPHNIYGD